MVFPKGLGRVLRSALEAGAQAFAQQAPVSGGDGAALDGESVEG